MQTRHRIPSLFNLSMVDVLCCALGCVILLWLVNFREAQRRTELAGETRDQLAQSEARVQELDREVAALREQLASALGSADEIAMMLEGSERERNLTQKEQAKATVRIEELVKDLAAMRQQAAALDKRLAQESRHKQDLASEITAAEKRIDNLARLLKDREAMVTRTGARADDLAERLIQSETEARKLRKEAALLEEVRTESRVNRDKLTTAEARVLTLEKELLAQKNELATTRKGSRDLDESRQALLRELNEARQNVGDLEKDKRRLIDETNRVRAASENRFAGITLTGKRVVFLVDMSGSMELLDVHTPALGKWDGVRSTLLQIMRSMPDLEKFQVILFSEDVSFASGTGQGWLAYDAKTSLQTVGNAMKDIKPRGNTNMSAAFEAAFRFRANGLDTIYVLSDGLPNLGAGLSAEEARTLKEAERSQILGRHIRNALRTDWNRPIKGQPRVRINTVGFFFESPEVGAFLWALARENDGSFVGMSKP